MGDLGVKMSGRFPWMICSIARAYSLGGKRADSEALYMELDWRPQREHASPAALAWAAWAAGYRDQAIRFVQRHSLARSFVLETSYEFKLLHPSHEAVIQALERMPQAKGLSADGGPKNQLDGRAGATVPAAASD